MAAPKKVLEGFVRVTKPFVLWEKRHPDHHENYIEVEGYDEKIPVPSVADFRYGILNKHVPWSIGASWFVPFESNRTQLNPFPNFPTVYKGRNKQTKKQLLRTNAATNRTDRPSVQIPAQKVKTRAETNAEIMDGREKEYDRLRNLAKKRENYNWLDALRAQRNAPYNKNLVYAPNESYEEISRNRNETRKKPRNNHTQNHGFG